MNRLVALSLPILLAAALSGASLPEKKSPSAGTWTLNAAKSKYSNGTLPKSATRTVETLSDGEKTSYDEVGEDGSRTSYTYTAKYDDQDCSISGSGRQSWRDDLLSGAETIALRPNSSNSYAAKLKKAGNIVMTMRVVTSKDGKVLTITANGADAKGQPTTFVTVWDKQ
jgi:hypothetical protein